MGPGCALILRGTCNVATHASRSGEGEMRERHQFVVVVVGVVNVYVLFAVLLCSTSNGVLSALHVMLLPSAAAAPARVSCEPGVLYALSTEVIS